MRFKKHGSLEAKIMQLMQDLRFILHEEQAQELLSTTTSDGVDVEDAGAGVQASASASASAGVEVDVGAMADVDARAQVDEVVPPTLEKERVARPRSAPEPKLEVVAHVASSRRSRAIVPCSRFVVVDSESEEEEDDGAEQEDEDEQGVQDDEAEQEDVERVEERYLNLEWGLE